MQQKHLKEQQKIFDLAEQIIQACRQQASSVQDEKLKGQLADIIDGVGVILIDTIDKSLDKDKIRRNVATLQVAACKLPLSMQQKASLNSVSLAIIKACLFILAFSVAASLGVMFHAWYNSYLTLEVFSNYVVGMTAFEIIPFSALGLFSFGMYKVNPMPESTKVTELQEDVAEFGRTILTELGEEIVEDPELEEPTLLQPTTF